MSLRMNFHSLVLPSLLANEVLLRLFQPSISEQTAVQITAAGLQMMHSHTVKKVGVL
jgi:hypothetical protein